MEQRRANARRYNVARISAVQARCSGVNAVRTIAVARSRRAGPMCVMNLFVFGDTFNLFFATRSFVRVSVRANAIHRATAVHLQQQYHLRRGMKLGVFRFSTHRKETPPSRPTPAIVNSVLTTCEVMYDVCWKKCGQPAYFAFE